MATRTQTGLIGVAGEYHVAAQLSMRDWLATVTIKNAPGTDVLAQHPPSGRLVSIQTKTTSIPNASFMLGKKDEEPDQRDSSWFVLVAMDGPDRRPDFYVLPRNHVSAMLWVGHQNWIATPGRSGRMHGQSTIRQIFPKDVLGYRERWDALLSPPSAMPYDLPEWFERHVGTYGLHPDHPDASRFGSP